MRKLLILGALCTTTLGASPALAQGVPFGPRVEGLIGYDKIVQKGTRSFSDASDTNYSFGKMTSEKLVYGGRVGYDFGMGGIAVGIDGELTNTSASDTESNYILATGDRRRMTFKAGLDFYVGGRVSAAISDNIVAYAMAGYTNLHVKEHIYDITDDPAAPVELSTNSHGLSGYRLGLGINFGNETWFGGPEYRYSHYTDGYSRHELLLTAGLRFGHVAPPPPPPPPAPPPPPPPPPATQTCPDGSVIPATDTCPAPPPPPPPPAPAPERGQ